MPEYIRVRDRETGAEHSIVKPPALDEDVLEVLDEPAVDYMEEPLPSTEPSKKKSSSGQKADTSKES